jgi:osmotically-inducible protein OsmY
MNEERPMTTSVVVPSDRMPGLEEPIVVSAEETPIALRIRDALLADPRIGGSDLQVRMSDEHAVISGTVRTEEQRDVALNIAGRYVGRDRVTDDIQTGDQASYSVCEA